jgi:mannose/cellobiose epimerase-like protein (N-acyl-D-glucosamine 2-epimerase family)
VSPSLSEAAATARAWLLEALLPLWTSAGFDDQAGQFVEALTPDGEPLPLPRRTLVQARQMFVCCVGGRLGWSGPWRERAIAAGEALLARGRGASGDWIYSFDAHGAPADQRGDLYTQAFVIMGFAEAGRALNRADFIAAARDTRDALDARWADPRGGFLEGETAPHPGRQNPHMHLLEAGLALHAASGEAGDLAWAERLADLFMTRLWRAPGLVPEAFDADWRPVATAGLAPGHQFEWAWLLDRLRAAGGSDRSSTAMGLAAFGERCGVGAGGFTVDELWLDGTVKIPDARLWPQTERLKAALARLGGGAEAAAHQAFKALSAYLDVDKPGTWRDLRLAGGGWRPGPAPASSAYHIAGAFEALISAAGGG